MALCKQADQAPDGEKRNLLERGLAAAEAAVVADEANALVGKAALLYYTPRLLGGDPVEGERLLRHALAVAPGYLDARLALARLLDARGDRDGARAAARRALGDAERDANPTKASEARRLLEHLRD